jgi:acyl-phosphate glycerol 3-phosphate acyltransferase
VTDAHIFTAAAGVAGYLAGSISFPYWIARRAGVDLRRAGSRKLGGGNLFHTIGPLAGTLGGVLDALKGAGAVVVVTGTGLGTDAALLSGVGAVSGQMWPVFHRFDGGRANATGWGFALAADPVAAAAMAVPMAAGLLLRGATRPRSTRILPVAALASFAVWPAVVLARHGPSTHVLAGVAVLLLIVVRRLTAALRADLATGAPAARVLWNRAMFDRSELQERGLVAI